MAIQAETIRQDVSHLMVGPHGLNPAHEFSVQFTTTPIEMRTRPTPGFSHVRMIFSSPCASDGGVRGYYHGARYHHDRLLIHASLDDKTPYAKKLANALSHMERSGIVSGEAAKLRLLETPNHEGVGVVMATSASLVEPERIVATFIPKIHDGKINGFEYGQVKVDPQALVAGNLVVVTAYLRCDQHWQIPPGQKFPDKCDRTMDSNHHPIPKMVPGHFELPGLSENAPHGLPKPNHMLVKVPEELISWAGVDPVKLRHLVTTEPLSCCFEALSPVLLAVEAHEEQPPKIITILGDGQNAANLALTATNAFPDAEIYVTGHTHAKLSAIERINPDKIHGVFVDRRSGKSAEKLKRILREQKIDILIPTFPTRSMANYGDLIDYDNSRVIVWASDQVGQNEHLESIIHPQRVHHSYGGWNYAEYTALQFMRQLAINRPEMLNAISEYPHFDTGLNQKGAAIMTEWLGSHAQFRPEGAKETPSVNVIFQHEDPIQARQVALQS